MNIKDRFSFIESFFEIPEPAHFGQVYSAKNFYKRFLYCIFVEQLLLFLPWVVGSMLFILLLASVVNFTESLRRFLLLFFILVNAGILGACALKFKKKSGVTIFCRFLEAQSFSFKNLLNAIELSQVSREEGISEDLKGKVIEDIEEILRNEKPESFIRIENMGLLARPLLLLIGVGLMLALFPPHCAVSGWNRMVYGSEEEFFRYLSIDPKGGRVSLGEPVTISVELLQTDNPLPALYSKSSGGWEEVNGETAGRKTFFKLDAIIEEVSYKVLWRNLESPVFSLVPYEPPRLTNFFVKLIFPSYTGLVPHESREEPQIRCLRGTKVEISAEASKPLQSAEMVSSLGVRYPVKLERDKNVSLSFTVQNPFDFWFEMKDMDGVSPTRPVRYSVSVKEDAPPSIRLLAPASDLIAGQESKIPFTFDFKDDMGASAVYLRVEKSGSSRTERFLLKKYSPPEVEKIESADFSLGTMKTEPGDMLKMNLEVQDNDLVSGPKSGFSDSILVEIQSYEKEHGQIEKEMKEFRKDLVDLLADQTAARISDEEWRNLSMDKESLNKKIDATVRKQSDIISATEKIEKNLEKTLSKMERDPLSDFAIWQEHAAIKETLQSLRQGAMQQAVKDFQDKKTDEGSRQQESAISELERLSALSEEVYKYSKMKDMAHAADRLIEKGEKLNEQLSRGAPMDSELMKILQDTLREAGEIISEIQKQMQNMPQELPDDFVNEPAMKKLNMGEMAENAGKIEQALRQGDIQSAIKMAQELLRQAKEARDIIAKASEDISLPGGGNLSGAAEKKQDALQKIIDQQENILQKTGEMESKRQKFELEKQKALLQGLALRQKRAIEESKALLNRVSQQSPRPPYNGEVVNTLNSVIPKMGKVLNELEQKNVMFSQKWLKEIIDDMAGGTRGIEAFLAVHRSTPVAEEVLSEIAFSSSTGGKLGEIRREEESILGLLKEGPKTGGNPFSKENMEELGQLSQDENRLSQETKKLRNELSELANQTALIGPELLDALKDAGGEMRSAEGSLNQAQTEPAQEQEEKALSHLRSGQQSLQSALQQLGKMEQASGMKQSGASVQPRGMQFSNQSGGQSGVKTGEVRIPGADDYLPPREFREEILESLKERYPKSQENIIKDYYKKLSQ